jgi:hypothetical protein
VREVPTGRLLRRRAQLQAALTQVGPVLRASVIERYTQCGHPGCKCMRGDKHGPAYYLTISYAKGRTRTVYIPKRLRPVAEQWVRNYQHALAALEEFSSINLELLRRKAPEVEG